jgi:hypothetical protein
MESTQVSSQLPTLVVNVFVVIVLVVGRAVTDVVIEKPARLLSVLVTLPVLVVLVVLLMLLVLLMTAVLDVAVVLVGVATLSRVVEALVLIAVVLLVLIPVPTHPAEPALHDENEATLGPTNQLSPNCPLYGLRYEEALDGK